MKTKNTTEKAVKKTVKKKEVASDDVKVKLHEYKGMLVIETVEPTKKHSDFIPAGGSSFGCILSNCSKKNLGISKEAFELLKKFRRGHDGLGDVDIFGANGGNIVFGWIGGPFAIKDPKNATGSREYNPSLLVGNHKETENSAPEGAKNAIDAD